MESLATKLRAAQKKIDTLEKENKLLRASWQSELYAERLFTLQYAEDAMLLAAGSEFGFGESRAYRLAEAYKAQIMRISGMIHQDSKDDKEVVYGRQKIDDELRQVCGKYFAVWDERYDRRRIMSGRSDAK